MSDDSLLKPSANRDREPGLVGGNDPVEITDPMVETYDDISRAYRTFNQRLFGGRLKPSLITLRARGKVPGYFFPLRFVRKDGRRSHEIALNPATFGYHTIEQCLSTLVHEMVHQAQFDSGTAGRRSYHNLDFARRMVEVGLPTSSTGAPGGKVTGERMSHFIAPDGAFLVVVRELLDASFRARWADRFVPEVGANLAEVDGPLDPLADLDGGFDDYIQPRGRAPSMESNPGAYAIGMQRGGKDPSKIKFVCPCCHQAAWGKGSLNLVCGKCSERMSAA